MTPEQILQSLASSYDEIPYHSRPHYATHPDCLATMGTLMGLHPAPADGCRLLELGCATGGNLIAMAVALPDSRFVGVDLSPRQIAAGAEIVQRLGLRNAELLACDLSAIDRNLGTFDYITCHGVYSWVPAEVQRRILEICGQQLNPQGVAYVSYNTYPGWHFRGLVKDMLRFHTLRFASPAEKLEQSRALLDFLAKSAPGQDRPYARVLQEEAGYFRTESDYYLFHEYLEEVNQPVYFHEFMERAAAHGLQYVGEAWHHTQLDNLPAELRETLQGVSANLIELEQYADFLRNRTFRRTLLCRADVPLHRSPTTETTLALSASALAWPLTSPPDVDSPAAVEFRTASGQSISTNIPVLKLLLWRLCEAWPDAVPARRLWEDVRPRLADSGTAVPVANEAALCAALLRCHLSNVVALHACPPRFTRTVGERPVASALARLQAETGSRVVNLRHQEIELDDLDRAVLPWLDGHHDGAQLREQLRQAVADGRLSVEHQGQPLAAADFTAEFADACVAQSVQHLADCALLPAPSTSGDQGLPGSPS